MHSVHGVRHGRQRQRTIFSQCFCSAGCTATRTFQPLDISASAGSAHRLEALLATAPTGEQLMAPVSTMSARCRHRSTAWMVAEQRYVRMCAHCVVCTRLDW